MSRPGWRAPAAPEDGVPREGEGLQLQGVAEDGQVGELVLLQPQLAQLLAGGDAAGVGDAVAVQPQPRQARAALQPLHDHQLVVVEEELAEAGQGTPAESGVKNWPS